MKTIKNSEFNVLKISDKDLIKAIEFKYFTYINLYLGLFGLFFLWSIIETILNNNPLGIWGLIWRTITSFISCVFTGGIIHLLLENNKIKFYVLLAVANVYSKIGYKTLKNLLGEVKKYNKSVQQFLLRCEGENIQITNKSIQTKVKRYHSLKLYILKAFKAESISRNYPEYSASKFETLIGLPETEKVMSKAEENNKVFDDYLKIEFSVEQEMQKLKNRRFNK